MTLQAIASLDAMQPARPASPAGEWSDARLARLARERRHVQHAFAFHPYVRVAPAAETPTVEYEVEYFVRTLCVEEDGQLQYENSARVRMTLTPEFPDTPPLVHPPRGLFHPNASWEGIHLSDGGWRPTDTLADFVGKLGELLAWRAYDPQSIVNEAAMQWLEANAESLPLTRVADFTPNAGGTPDERIARLGPAELDAIESGLQRFGRRMLGETPADSTDARELARHVERSLEVFGSAPALRDRVAGLRAWAADLARAAPTCDALRRERAQIQKVAAATADLGHARDALGAQLDSILSLAPAAPPIDLATALAAIPSTALLDAPRLKLPPLLREAERRAHETRVEAARLLEDPIECGASGDSPLGRQIRAAIEATSAAARSTRDAAYAASDAIAPLLARARAEAAAIARLAEWREFLDLHRGGAALVARVLDLGAAGVHAFFIESDAGAFGPFQMDEAVQLSSGQQFTVRSTARNRLRLIDVATARLVGRSDTGELTIGNPTEMAAEMPDPPQATTTFRVTDRWDDLAVRFDFLLRQTTSLLSRLVAAPPEPASSSWCGAVLGVLADAAAIGAVREQHRAAAVQWHALLRDLQALGPVKARIETCNLVQRLRGTIQDVRRQLEEARAALASSEQDLAAIAARCGRDIDTGRLVIPPAWAARFADAISRRTRATADIPRLEKRLVELGDSLAGQFADADHAGLAGVPAFEALPPFPEELATAIEAMTDDSLAADASELEASLGRAILPRPPEPAEPQPVEEDQTQFDPSTAEETDPADPAQGQWE